MGGAGRVIRYYLAASRFGPFALLFEDGDQVVRIRRVLLSRPGHSARAALREAAIRPAPRPPGAVRDLTERIATFLDGEVRRFDLRVVALARCRGFQQRVLRAEHTIPRGRVSSYGRLAVAVGRPGAARAVGRALARNPFPIVIPCHRALRADRGLGGYQGGARMKRRLLEAEGIDFDARGRAVIDRWYDPSR
ncbi:MAG: methylated-DNA--[protein]-cysteine S-methyltransferase [Candidatus Eisenbacteria bacterium]|nr:methylated-DNA--[protein]-cysteine S-methyltransferase [Candidatus Eisenbacteria bacterium]